MEEQRRTLAGTSKVIAKVLLSYFDLLTDAVLAITLLGTEQATYGVVSFAILGLSLFVQALIVTAIGKAPWLSKDVFMTMTGFGPALEAYRSVFGEPQRPGAQPAISLLGILKMVEVVFETFPELVLQLTLLLNEPSGWSSPVLLISLVVSIVAASVMIVDAESAMNRETKARRLYHEYFGYLPLRGTRRYILLLTMTFFTGGYLVLATSTLAVAVRLFPLSAVLAVLAFDSAIYHVLRMAAGEWWIVSDSVRKGMGAWVGDFLTNTILWIQWHVCPVWLIRDPNWAGPPVMAWAIACSLTEYTGVICTVLLFPLVHPATAQTRTMVCRICLPALCAALVSLMAFFVTMEKRYRRTFYARDSRYTMHRRHWAEAGRRTREGRATADEDRAHIAGGDMRYVGGLASAWIVDGAAKWEHSKEAAVWYSEEWRHGVRRHAHLMGSRATEALAAMRDDQPRTGLGSLHV